MSQIKYYDTTTSTWLTVSGTPGPIGPAGPTGPQGLTGSSGSALVYKGTVAAVVNLPASSNTTNDTYAVTADASLYAWTGSAWVKVGPYSSAGYAGVTSTTSLAIATGSKAFTLTFTGAFVVGDRVRVVNTGSSTNWMEGTITALTTNSAITVNVDVIGGSGTLAAWTFSIAGIQGATGTTGPAGPTGTTGTTTLPILSALPVSPAQGYVYYLTTNNSMNVYNGTATYSIPMVSVTSAAAPTTGTYPAGMIWFQI